MNSIYTLIFNHFQPLAQQVSRTSYADSLISEKFQIEMSPQFISIWTPNENVWTLSSQEGNLLQSNSKGALRIVDLTDVNKRFATPQEAFNFVKSLFA
jgi:hypothetical protein